MNVRQIYSFARDSRINGVQKSSSSEISKKNERGTKLKISFATDSNSE